MDPSKNLSTEQKCRQIYEILIRKPEHKDNPTCRTFKNLGKFGILMNLNKDNTPRLLNYVHFSMDRTEFLPNDILFWKELRKGEYEKTVNSLLTALAD